MTIETSVTKTKYLDNGSSREWPLPFMANRLQDQERSKKSITAINNLESALFRFHTKPQRFFGIDPFYSPSQEKEAQCL